MGREDELKKLHQILQTENQVSVCAIAGMGGIGKTSLALKYALNYGKDYQGGICWLNARGLDASSQLLSFARTNLELSISEEMDFSEQLAYCWRNWVEGTALIIYDDVQEFSDVQTSLPPAHPKFKVLLTSRQRLGINMTRLDLDVLPPQKALGLLQSLVTDGRIEAELGAANVLCESLGYLPLAIELVGRYLDRSPTDGIVDVQGDLDSLRLQAEALLREAELDADMTAKLGVAQAFELSWKKLSPSAQQLGWQLSLFAPTIFNWIWVEACHPDSDLKTLKKQRDLELLRLNLLQYMPNEDVSLPNLTKQFWFRFHPLIREFFATKRVDGQETENYQRRFCEVMAREAHKIEQVLTSEQVRTLKPAISHLEEMVKNILNWIQDKDIIWIYQGLGWFYQNQGAYLFAERWFQECRQIISTRLADNHIDLATSLNNLALLYRNQERYGDAEFLYLEALTMRQKLLGDNHLDVATSLSSLANIYRSQGRYNEAELLYLEALTIRQHQLNNDNPYIAQTLNNLALLYCNQRRYEESENLHQQALAIRKKILGDESIYVAYSLNNLAYLYYCQGCYDKAEFSYLKALDIKKKLLHNEHPSLASTFNNLAMCYNAQGKYEEAELLCKQALTIRERILGNNAPSVARTLNNLADIYHNQGNNKNARSLYEESLTICRQKLGENHPHTVKVKLNLKHLLDSS